MDFGQDDNSSVAQHESRWLREVTGRRLLQWPGTVRRKIELAERHVSRFNGLDCDGELGKPQGILPNLLFSTDFYVFDGVRVFFCEKPQIKFPANL